MTRALWQRYLDATGDRGARPLVEEALTRRPAPGQALDLGCGAGGDTLAMLEAGHEVLAVDALDDALEHTRARARLAGLDARLTTRCARFEELVLTPRSYDLVVASFSLPFCAPERFDAVWDALVATLRPGALFAGQLFGERDAWAADDSHPSRVFLTRAGVEARLAGLDTLALREDEERRATALGDEKDWHLFHFLVAAPEAGTA